MANILNVNEDYNPKNGLKVIYTKLIEIIQKVNTLWSNSPNVKVYEALLSQAGTEAPIVESNGSGANTPLVNTLGENPSLIRYDVGQYYLLLPTDSNINKVTVFITPDSAGGFIFARPASYIGGVPAVYINTTDALLANADDVLNVTSIIIKVYP